eukprot:scaffold249529_cov35-Tisochrysis_lutea.AAC.5
MVRVVPALQVMPLSRTTPAKFDPKSASQTLASVCRRDAGVRTRPTVTGGAAHGTIRPEGAVGARPPSSSATGEMGVWDRLAGRIARACSQTAPTLDGLAALHPCIAWAIRAS